MARNRKRPWTPVRLKQLRNGYGESQARFARRLNVSVQAIRAYEQGTRPIRGPLVRLLDLLKADADAGVKSPHPDDEPALAGAGR